MEQVQEVHKVTVDSGKATEKEYEITFTFDLSLLDAADIKVYALDAITVKCVNPLRKKGHDYLKSLNGVFTYLVPKPGTRTQLTPAAALRAVSLEALEKELAERKAALAKAKK